MAKRSFLFKNFLRILLVFLSLSISWTTLCIRYNEFTDRDKGFITGLGFISLFALSFYLGMPLKKVKHLVILLLVFLLTFVVSSFIIGPLFGFVTDSYPAFAIASSLFTCTVLAYILDRIYTIKYYYATIIAAICFALTAQYLWTRYDEYLQVYYNIHPRIFMFNIYQLMVLLPLAIGVSVREEDEGLE
jgi:hypothetical protein